MGANPTQTMEERCAVCDNAKRQLNSRVISELPVYVVAGVCLFNPNDVPTTNGYDDDVFLLLPHYLPAITCDLSKLVILVSMFRTITLAEIQHHPQSDKIMRTSYLEISNIGSSFTLLPLLLLCSCG